MNYRDLTISQILELAGGGPDDMQQARRIARRLSLEVKRLTAALSEAEVVELVSLVEVTDGDLASRAMTERAEAKTKAVARRMYWGCD